MLVGVPLLVPGALGLFLNVEPGTGEPGADLPHARVVMVVAVGPIPDDLTVHHWKARPSGRLVARPHPIPGGKLDRQVQPTL
jgi:hypothetical protein